MLSGLRLRNLVFLLSYVCALLVGIVALHVLAQRSSLHQSFFTYRARIKIFGKPNMISPFSVVPTIFAVVITLWWESVDTTCRTVQPYVSIRHTAKTPLSSVGLSYGSSFWIWASWKALRRRHWVLALVTTTTFLIQLREQQLVALLITVSADLIHSHNCYVSSIRL